MELNRKMLAFAHEYVNLKPDEPRKLAVLRAGYSNKGADVTATRLLKNTKIQEFIAKRKLKTSEKEAFKDRGVADFSIAHLEEVIIRSLLHDKTIPQTIKEMVDHKKKFNESFAEKKSLGIGI